MTIKQNYWITRTIAATFILLFLYSAVSKLYDYEIFKDEISENPILQHFTSFIAVALLCAEFATVVLLAVPRWKLTGLYVSFSLMLLFTTYIIALLMVSNGIPCSCGGLLENLSLKQHLVFNSAFILLAFIGIRQQRKVSTLNKTNYGV